MKVMRFAALACLLVLLAACASPGGRLQSAGRATAFDMQMDTTLDWARIRGPRQEFWTIDGLPLNQLRIYSNIKPDEHVFLQGKARTRRPDGPWFRPGMRADEVRDIVLAALAREGWLNVRAEALRPAQFGEVPGLRFDVALSNVDGLLYRGMAAAAERDGKLTVLIWMAPAEHYYGRDAAAVTQMLASLRFVR
jgi:hypothetical protein